MPSNQEHLTPGGVLRETVLALEAALEWIDAVPVDTPLPAMPGFDRDWVNGVRSRALRAAAELAPKGQDQ